MNKHRRDARPMALADWFGLACMILMAAFSVILYIRLKVTDMMADTILTALKVGLIAINVIFLAVLIPRWRNKLPKLIAAILALVISIGQLYAIVAADSVQKALVNISGQMVEKEITYIYVMNDNKDDIGDAMDYSFGALAHADVENTTALLAKLKEGLGNDVTHTPFETVPELVQALYDNQVDAIILNQGYIALLEEMEEFATFSQLTRVFYEFTTVRDVEPIQPNPAITREPFAVYCSGIDARSSDINIKSLSDVNILAVIHPETHQVLLLNTPRDYYVPMISEPYAGMRDKLTHAGSIGIEESMKVLGNLYGVDIQYYARVNFSGLIDIVDALGGIDVYSDYDFTSNSIAEDYAENWYDYREYSFTQGMNHINGYEALAFARQRNAFEDGDEQRGKNQMAVIKGIVDKATSPAILSSYDDLLKAVEGCFITNMPYEDISALVRMQLKDMRGWDFTTFAVSGDPDSQECATMPGWDLWVMWPDEDTVEVAKALVQQVWNGEVPTLPAE